MLRSSWHKFVATGAIALSFVLFYQAQTFDSRYAARNAVHRETVALPSPGARLRFTATAYCKGSVTASGVAPRTGVAAADPTLLPVGSVIQLSTESRHSGVYTVMDTGPAVQGRQLDIYMWSCHEALRFGRRAVDVVVLRMGWDPTASPLSFRDAFLNRPRPPKRDNLPSTSLPIAADAPPK